MDPLIIKEQLPEGICATGVYKGFTELIIDFRQIVLNSAQKKSKKITKEEKDSINAGEYNIIALCPEEKEVSTKPRCTIIMMRSLAEKLDLTPLREATKKEESKYL